MRGVLALQEGPRMQYSLYNLESIKCLMKYMKSLFHYVHGMHPYLVTMAIFSALAGGLIILQAHALSQIVNGAFLEKLSPLARFIDQDRTALIGRDRESSHAHMVQ